MIPWISFFLSIVMLSQYECMNCDSTEYPYDDYTKKSCRPHESPDRTSCEVVPIMYVNNSEAGTVVVEFNILSKSCNVSNYAFRFEVDENLNETNCKSKLFKGNEHSAERVVLIKHDETVQSCGNTQSVTFEQVYQGCYTLGYIYTVDNKLTQKLITQYLKTSYKKEAAPCDETYITPINIRRNAVEISMANFSKFDMIYATVTKPEGSFTCDDKTDLKKRFMWVMTHDSKGTFMCKRNEEKHHEEINCREYNHNIDCAIHNIAPGNYCYYVIMSYVYCNPLNSKRGLHHKFTVPEEPILGKAQEGTPDKSVMLASVFFCLIAVCFIVLIIMQQRKARSLLELYVHEEEYPLPQGSKILLLYCHDCEQFMEMMTTFRELLKEITKCKVYDCFDPILGEEVGQNKVEWIQSRMSSDNFKIVVIESSAAVIHQQALLHHSKVAYREPTWLDELFLYGLKALTDDVRRNTYQHVFVIRIDGFTEKQDFLNYLAPHRRYSVPQHLEMLLDDLSPESNSRFGPSLDDGSDGYWQKFEHDLKNLMNYKMQNPGYLNELISIV